MASARWVSVAPWLGLIASICVQMIAGNTYCFPLYSSQLKAALGYNQVQLSNLGVANDIGENVGLLAGFLCNKMPPWSILFVGGAVSFVGYGIVWLSITGVINSPYIVVWLALCIATNSATWFNTAVLVTNMRNFPLSRGTLAGILKGYIGISAAVYTEIYAGVLGKDSEKLLLFLTVGIPAISLLVMYFVRPCTPATEVNTRERKYFIFIQATSIVLAFYLLVTTIISTLESVSSVVTILFVVFMILLILAPSGIPARLAIRNFLNARSYNSTESDSREAHLLAKEESGLSSNSSRVENTQILEKSESRILCVAHPSFEVDEDDDDMELLLAEGEGAIIRRKRPRRGDDFKLHQALVKADFWLLFLAYFCGVGSGITVLNNLAQIGYAGGLKGVTILLSLFSICNFIGRLGGGAVSEYFFRWKVTPRTIWMVISQLVMIVGYLIFASAFTGSLYIGCVLLGICYGVQFSVMVPTASELFGLRHFGIIYNFLTIGNPLGALLFSGFLAGYIYDKEVEKQSNSGGILHENSSAKCLGPNCFRLTFLILAGVCAIGASLGMVLTWRIKQVYEMLHSRGSFSISKPPTT